MKVLVGLGIVAVFIVFGLERADKKEKQHKV
jgi:hypothetical protein